MRYIKERNYERNIPTTHILGHHNTSLCELFLGFHAEHPKGPATCKNCIRIVKAEAKKYDVEWRKVKMHPKKGQIRKSGIDAAVKVVVDSGAKHYRSLEKHHGAIIRRQNDSTNNQ